jgi:hypothetical protein
MMLLLKDLETLIFYGTFSEMLFIAIALSSIFYFRYTRPLAYRPIKVSRYETSAAPVLCA